MIISVDELRMFVQTDESDPQLGFRIQAVESFVKRYTNNDFKDRSTNVESFPDDVKLGVINLLKWDFQNRDKVGISSETISRHSVTYSGMDADNSIGGYPKSLVGFLNQYMKARF